MDTERPEFENPDFIDDYEADEIQERMMENLPEDISNMPGDFAYDFTMPTAIEISQMVQFSLVRVLMIAFPQFAWGEWLDYHGNQVQVFRKEAVAAEGYIDITGEEGTEIESGTAFCVPANDDEEDIEFETTQTVTLEEGVTAHIPIIAVEAGASGNVAAGTITMIAEPIDGIETITNNSSTSGGLDEEDDEAYCDRILAAYSSSLYYIGNDTDYKRWAKEITGIGDCVVVPAWDGPGTVKLILVDSNGSPASQSLVTQVYNHIVSPNDRSARLLPTACADLTCVAAASRTIDYSCTDIVLDGTKTLEEVMTAFEEAVLTTYADAKEAGMLRYNSVRPLMSSIGGVSDFGDFKVNDGYTNVVLDADEYPVTGTVVFTEEE